MLWARRALACTHTSAPPPTAAHRHHGVEALATHVDPHKDLTCATTGGGGVKLSRSDASEPWCPPPPLLVLLCSLAAARV